MEPPQLRVGRWSQLSSNPQVIDLTEDDSPRITQPTTRSTPYTDVVEILSDDDDVEDDGGVGPSNSSGPANAGTQNVDDDNDVQFVRETAPRPSVGSSTSASSSTRRRNISLLESTLMGSMTNRRSGSASRGSSQQRQHSRSPSQARGITAIQERQLMELLDGIERTEQQRRRRRMDEAIRHMDFEAWFGPNDREGYRVRYNANNNRRVFEPNPMNYGQQNPFFRAGPLWPGVVRSPFPLNHPAYAFYPGLDYHFSPEPPAPVSPTSATNAGTSTQIPSRTSKVVSARPGYTKLLNPEPNLACPKCLREFDGDKEDDKEVKVSIIVGCGHVVCNDCAEAMFLTKKPLKKVRATSRKGKQKATSATALGKRRRSHEFTQELKTDAPAAAGDVEPSTTAVAAAGGGGGQVQAESLLSDEDKGYEWIKRATGLCPACNRRVRPKAVVQLYV